MPLIHTIPLGSSQSGDPVPQGRQLLVAGPDVFMTYPLPEVGSLEIGRSERAQLRLDDPSASRHHATLHVDRAAVYVEDHDSVNGTFLRGAAVAPNQRLLLNPGEAVQIGATLLMLQQRSAPLQMLRVWPHVQFEGRVEDECHRAEQMSLPFCILRVAVDDSVLPEALVAALHTSMRWTDALAAYGPGEWEVLLAMRPTEDDLDDAIEGVVTAFEQSSVQAEAVIARFPEDGRTADALLSVVQDRLHRGGLPAAATNMVVADPVMVTLYDLARRAAQSDITLLVLGETGVGKDVLARSIHQSSKRAHKAYLSINCAAVQESLLESELFGHEKGAFTGAVATKIGLLESASGGTVFLDEVGEMSPAMQAKLLRVLENREIVRVGALTPRTIDVRFIAATNRDLERDVELGRFRRDAYFRLAGITLGVPPLRERRNEILPLTMRFLAEAAIRMDRPVPAVSAEAAELLTAYNWPGNIRELRNIIERALVLCAGSEIQSQHLPTEKLRLATTEAVNMPAAPPGGAAAAVARERQREGHDELALITEALAAAAGNQTRAAKALGIPRRTFLRRLESLGVARPHKTDIPPKP